MYRYEMLDPCGSLAAQAANEIIFDAGPVLGIEVTIPSLAARCMLGNIDPQHSNPGHPGDWLDQETQPLPWAPLDRFWALNDHSVTTGYRAGRYLWRMAVETAIEVSALCGLPPDGAILATVRADLDAVGAMAVFSIRARGESLESARGRITTVAASDKFARGGYIGPKPLPTRDNPWVEEAAGGSFRSLAAIAAAVVDFKVPLADRVATMEKWLLTGEEPKQYRDSVERERLDMIVALETGQIKYETRSGGRIAVVESTHRAATSVGYSLAPVVVALNPSFKEGSSEPYRKFTICQFAGGFVDMKSALAELNELENGWGGSPNIIGSTQGVSSQLTIDEVAAIVEKHRR